ncbi:hypothetical protein DFJ58DRAFT_742036 [Suillus subalutaceus]|uniref:uncharacterized protein n=1 Tax=Suillus subalutaceus TaxID=48586 RepID=UPI001B87BED3|nr:uncharacterized protein DFJ58DRAFT_742036 [Suillus subalutaceus]KAG1871252.1 hypothetical protein DFJ58DRAFT_742036 [Suillus subalutaceus]
MQLVVLLLGTADHRYPPYLWRRDLRLQETCNVPPSFASANSSASLTNGACPDRKDQSRDPLDFPATLPLPPNHLHGKTAPPTLLPGRAFFNSIRSSSDKGKQKAREPKRKTVNVPLGQATYGDVVGVDDGRRPFVLFFCLSWFQKKEMKQEPRPVYDDELEDDEEENALGPVALPPPRVQHEEIELKTMTSQSRSEAGPSRLVVTDHLEAQSS